MGRIVEYPCLPRALPCPAPRSGTGRARHPAPFWPLKKGKKEKLSCGSAPSNQAGRSRWRASPMPEGGWGTGGGLWESGGAGVDLSSGEGIAAAAGVEDSSVEGAAEAEMGLKKKTHFKKFFDSIIFPAYLNNGAGRAEHGHIHNHTCPAPCTDT
ncbi:hypothetical protein CRG98_024764 [Punica granatum]|uniref:Uncharacterized protein n=1 Tax=Punica granatum TaxID=22663 RepID=A0A2I0JFS4_PUNGR|nr:hypothetical protein CRG98_024764 [Punica granatum]